MIEFGSYEGVNKNLSSLRCVFPYARNAAKMIKGRFTDIVYMGKH